MITLTRFNGQSLLLNDRLIETVEETPDTVVTMENGHRYFVKESLSEIMAQIADNKALRTPLTETAEEE
jgi:flagellar protein FlbD